MVYGCCFLQSMFQSHLDAHLGHGLDLRARGGRRARGTAALDDGGELRVARVARRARHLGLLLGVELEQRDARLLVAHRLFELLHECERRLREARALRLAGDGRLELLVGRLLLDQPRALLLDVDERRHPLPLDLVLALRLLIRLMWFVVSWMMA